MNFSLWLFLSLASSLVSAEIMKISTGYINSTRLKTKKGRNFLAYYGIPYAAPPIGQLRLKPPVDPQPWQGVRESKPPPICLQPRNIFETSYSSSLGQEDCLYLNVFVPQPDDKKSDKLPVMVFIHGGSYKSGSANLYSPEYLMDKNVLLVTMNYRLGALGFLSMSNDVIAGNYGFKDQVLALKWVQRNIKVLGGNPNQVTLFGHSSGAGCAHLHMFSPTSEGAATKVASLFHRAILSSGSAFSGWNTYNRNFTFALGTAFTAVTGCYRDNPIKVLACLQNLKPGVFVQKEETLRVWEFEPILLFKGSMETNLDINDNPKRWKHKMKVFLKKYRDGTKDMPFLPMKPSSQTYINRVPFMVGQTTADGSIVAVRYLTDNARLARALNYDYQKLLPIITGYLYLSSRPEDVEKIGDKIKEFYFGNQNIGSNTDQQLVDLMTDFHFTYPVAQTVLSSSHLIPTYVYLYDHKDAYHSQMYSKLYDKDLGVTHGEELRGLFYRESIDKQLTANDRRISEEILDYWTNFAIYGDPNGKSNKNKKWKPTTRGTVEYLHIKSENSTMQNTFFNDRYNFWNSLPLGIEHFKNLR